MASTDESKKFYAVSFRDDASKNAFIASNGDIYVGKFVHGYRRFGHYSSVFTTTESRLMDDDRVCDCIEIVHSGDKFCEDYVISNGVENISFHVPTPEMDRMIDDLASIYTRAAADGFSRKGIASVVDAVGKVVNFMLG